MQPRDITGVSDCFHAVQCIGTKMVGRLKVGYEIMPSQNLGRLFEEFRILMANEIVTAKATKPEKKSERKIERIHIEPAENGFTVSTSFEPPKTRGNNPGYYQEPERNVFASVDDVADHVKKSFGGKKEEKG